MPLITLNSPSGILLISISLRSLVVNFSCSFIWDIVICLILSASRCLCVCARKVSCVSCPRRWWTHGEEVLSACRARSLLTRTWCFRALLSMCCVPPCPTAVWLGRVCLRSRCPHGCFCLLWAVFAPCDISGSVWGHPGLEPGQTGYLAELQTASLHCPPRHFHGWAGPAV